MTVAHFWFDETIYEAETLDADDSNPSLDPYSEGWRSLLRCAMLCSRADFLRQVGWFVRLGRRNEKKTF
jgi:hypothetical protein